MITLTGIHLYPVKSARGITVGRAEITERGILHDRRFMIVDAQGQFVTQRELPQLARLSTAIVGDALLLSFDEARPLELPLTPWDGELRRVQVWDDTVDALELTGEASAFVSRGLGAELSLVYMPDATVRPVDGAFGAADDVVSFADGFPCLLTNESSRQHVELHAGEPIPMDRFRPNLVVSGAPPYAEDSWGQATIGEIPFAVVKPCTRCVMTTTDQRTGARVSKEPLSTLARERRWQGKAIFGQNLIPRKTGQVSVGDPVVVATRAGVATGAGKA